MDITLRCNSLKCRVHLTARAVVTTCSHIFCVPCSEALQLSNVDGNTVRVCPACETQLVNPDDAVVTQLNPTEDYKTSVLSGLSPNIIMECAGRGLSFYTYQTSQEIVYQEFLTRSLTDKYSTLNSQMDKIINDANTEIVGLREKLSNMHVERKSLEQKNHELQKAFREKAKNQQQLTRLYQALKQQQVAAGMEFAAEQDVEQTLHGLRRSPNINYGPHIQSPVRSHGSGGSGEKRHMPKTGIEHQMPGRGSVPATDPTSIHFGHRTPLPARVNHGHSNIRASRAGSVQQNTSYRPPLSQIDSNISHGIGNVSYRGLPAGVKVGHQQRGIHNFHGQAQGEFGSVRGFNLN